MPNIAGAKARIGLLLLCAVLFGLSGWCTIAQADPAKKPLTFEEYKHAVSKVDFKLHTMPLERLKAIYEQPDVHVFDLRSEREYNEGHLKRAVHLGADIKEERLNQLVPDKNAIIVVYCINTFFPVRQLSLCHVALPQLIALGYPKTYELQEIWPGVSPDGHSKLEPLWEGKPLK